MGERIFVQGSLAAYMHRGFKEIVMFHQSQEKDSGFHKLSNFFTLSKRIVSTLAWMAALVTLFLASVMLRWEDLQAFTMVCFTA